MHKGEGQYLKESHAEPHHPLQALAVEGMEKQGGEGTVVVTLGLVVF